MTLTITWRGRLSPGQAVFSLFGGAGHLQGETDVFSETLGMLDGVEGPARTAGQADMEGFGECAKPTPVMGGQRRVDEVMGRATAVIGAATEAAGIPALLVGDEAVAVQGLGDERLFHNPSIAGRTTTHQG